MKRLIVESLIIERLIVKQLITERLIIKSNAFQAIHRETL